MVFFKALANLAVRDKPDGSADTIAQIKKAEVVNVEEQQDSGWFRILYCGRDDLWVLSKNRVKTMVEAIDDQAAGASAWDNSDAAQPSLLSPEEQAQKAKNLKDKKTTKAPANSESGASSKANSEDAQKKEDVSKEAKDKTSSSAVVASITSTFYTTTKPIIVREAANSSAIEVATIATSDTIRVEEEKEGWCRLSLRGRTDVWIYSLEDSTTAENSTSSGATSEGQFFKALATMKVRDQPAGSGEEVASVEKGAVVKMIEQKDDGWCRLSLRGTSNYWVLTKNARSGKSFIEPMEASAATPIWEKQEADLPSLKTEDGDVKKKETEKVDAPKPPPKPKLCLLPVGAAKGLKAWEKQEAAAPSLLGSTNEIDAKTAGGTKEASSSKHFYKAIEVMPVREKPDVSSNEVATIAIGEILRVEEMKEDGWFRLALGGRLDLWVYTRAEPSDTPSSSTSDSPAEPAQAPGALFFKALATMKARDSPSGSAEEVISVEKGEYVKVEEQKDDGWCRISLRGRTDLWILTKNARSGKVFLEGADASASQPLWEKQEADSPSLLSEEEAAKKKTEEKEKSAASQKKHEADSKKEPAAPPPMKSFVVPELDVDAALKTWNDQEYKKPSLLANDHKAIESSSNLDSATYYEALDTFIVRNAPQAEATEVATISHGEVIKVEEKNEDSSWFRISLRDREDVWIHVKAEPAGSPNEESATAAPIEDAAAQATTPEPEIFFKALATMKARVSPSGSEDEVATVEKGNIVKIEERKDDGWCRISLRGRTDLWILTKNARSGKNFLEAAEAQKATSEWEKQEADMPSLLSEEDAKKKKAEDDKKSADAKKEKVDDKKPADSSKTQEDSTKKVSDAIAVPPSEPKDLVKLLEDVQAAAVLWQEQEMKGPSLLTPEELEMKHAAAEAAAKLKEDESAAGQGPGTGKRGRKHRLPPKVFSTAEKYKASVKMRAAAQRGDVDEVLHQLRLGAEVDAPDEVEGWTALMEASARNHVAVVAVLLHRDASLDHQDIEGNTAMDLADEKDYSEVVAVLESETRRRIQAEDAAAEIEDKVATTSAESGNFVAEAMAGSIQKLVAEIESLKAELAIARMVENQNECSIENGGNADNDTAVQGAEIGDAESLQNAVELPPATFFKAVTELKVVDAPSDGSSSVASLEAGAILRAEEEREDGWLRLCLRGRNDVWVMSKPPPAATAESPAPGGAQFFKAVASLQCRNKPEGGADAVVSVSKNDIVKVEEQKADGWFRLSLRGREDLWILSKNARTGKVMVEAVADAAAAMATWEKQEASGESLLSPDEVAKKKKEAELAAKKKIKGEKPVEVQAEAPKALEVFVEVMDAATAEPLWWAQDSAEPSLVVEESATPEASAPSGNFFKATSDLKARDAPDSNAQEVASVAKGDVMLALEEQDNGWFRLSLRGRSDVWVMSKPSASPDNLTPGGAQFFKAVASLQCRNKPEGGADAVVSVSKNDIVKVEEQKADGWFRLSLRGREDLWILSKNARTGKVMVEAVADAAAAMVTWKKQEASGESLLSPDEVAKKKKEAELAKKRGGKKESKKVEEVKSFVEGMDEASGRPTWEKQEAGGPSLVVDQAREVAAPVAEKEDQNSAEPAVPSGNFFKAISNMAVRDGPSPDSDSVCNINKGQIVNVLELQSDGWFRISLRDRDDLWVLSKNARSGKEFLQQESDPSAAKTWAQQEASEPSFLTDDEKKKKQKNDAMKAKIAAKNKSQAKPADKPPKETTAEEKPSEASSSASAQAKEDTSPAKKAAPEGSTFFKALANLAVRDKPDSAGDTLSFSVAKGEIIHVEDGGNRGDGWMEIYFRGRDDVWVRTANAVKALVEEVSADEGFPVWEKQETDQPSLLDDATLKKIKKFGRKPKKKVNASKPPPAASKENAADPAAGAAAPPSTPATPAPARAGPPEGSKFYRATANMGVRVAPDGGADALSYSVQKGEVIHVEEGGDRGDGWMQIWFRDKDDCWVRTSNAVKSLIEDIPAAEGYPIWQKQEEKGPSLLTDAERKKIKAKGRPKKKPATTAPEADVPEAAPAADASTATTADTGAPTNNESGAPAGSKFYRATANMGVRVAPDGGADALSYSVQKGEVIHIEEGGDRGDGWMQIWFRDKDDCWVRTSNAVKSLIEDISAAEGFPIWQKQEEKGPSLLMDAEKKKIKAKGRPKKKVVAKKVEEATDFKPAAAAEATAVDGAPAGSKFYKASATLNVRVAPEANADLITYSVQKGEVVHVEDGGDPGDGSGWVRVWFRDKDDVWLRTKNATKTLVEEVSAEVGYPAWQAQEKKGPSLLTDTELKTIKMRGRPKKESASATMNPPEKKPKEDPWATKKKKDEGPPPAAKQFYARASCWLEFPPSRFFTATDTITARAEPEDDAEPLRYLIQKGEVIHVEDGGGDLGDGWMQIWYRDQDYAHVQTKRAKKNADKSAPEDIEVLVEEIPWTEGFPVWAKQEAGSPSLLDADELRKIKVEGRATKKPRPPVKEKAPEEVKKVEVEEVLPPPPKGSKFFTASKNMAVREAPDKDAGALAFSVVKGDVLHVEEGGDSRGDGWLQIYFRAKDDCWVLTKIRGVTNVEEIDAETGWKQWNAYEKRNNDALLLDEKQIKKLAYERKKKAAKKLEAAKPAETSPAAPEAQAAPPSSKPAGTSAPPTEASNTATLQASLAQAKSAPITPQTEAEADKLVAAAANRRNSRIVKEEALKHENDEKQQLAVQQDIHKARKALESALAAAKLEGVKMTPDQEAKMPESLALKKLHRSAHELASSRREALREATRMQDIIGVCYRNIDASKAGIEVHKLRKLLDAIKLEQKKLSDDSRLKTDHLEGKGAKALSTSATEADVETATKAVQSAEAALVASQRSAATEVGVNQSEAVLKICSTLRAGAQKDSVLALLTSGFGGSYDHLTEEHAAKAAMTKAVHALTEGEPGILPYLFTVVDEDALKAIRLPGAKTWTPASVVPQTTSLSARKTLSKKFYVQFVCAFTLQPCYLSDGKPGMEIAGDLKDWVKTYGDALESSLSLLKAYFVLAHSAGAPVVLAEDSVLSAESLMAAVHILGGGKGARPKTKGVKGGTQGEASTADFLRAFTNASDAAAAQRIERAVSEEVVRAHVLSTAYKDLANWVFTQDPHSKALTLKRCASSDGVYAWVSDDYMGAWGNRLASDLFVQSRWGVMGDELDEEEAVATAPSEDDAPAATGDAALQNMVLSLQEQMSQMMAMQAQFIENNKNQPPPKPVAVEEAPPGEKTEQQKQARPRQRKGSTF